MKLNIFSESNDKDLRGIIFIIFSAFFFSIMGCFIKLSSSNLAILEIIFIRTLLAFGICSLIINKKEFLRTKVLHLHFLRTIFGLSAMFLMFYSISKLPLSNVAIISFSKIFFIIPLSIFFLKEKINLFSIIYILIGYLGVLIVISFDRDNENLYYYSCALLGAFFIALVKVVIKKISKFDDAIIIQFWFSGLSLLFLLIPYIFIAKFPTLIDFIYVLLASLAGLLAQFFTVSGLRVSDANTVMPFDFSRVIFSTIIGLFFFGELISFAMIIGASLLVIAGYFLASKSIKKRL